ncbi:hypothetical protein ACTFIU_002784 [Dictyostelium citrinum]
MFLAILKTHIIFLVIKKLVPFCKIDKNDLGVTENVEWYTYQLPEDGGVYFWDSITDTVVEKEGLTKSLRFDDESAFLQTFKQFENKDYNYVTYNDQPDDENWSYPMGAHSKGFFIWNKDGGIHVTHSITQFPYFKTKRNDPSIPEGIFQKNKRGDLAPGLELFNHLTKSKTLKESKYQQAQHAYCYPISKEEIQNGHIYRHLVLTNSIIGYVNDLAINLCLTTLEQAGYLLKSLNPTEFPRVNLMRIQDIKEFETRNTIYQNVDIQESQITTAILKDVIYYNLEDKFPLFILAKHALYFAQYSKKQHLSSAYTKDSKQLYFYQKHINTNEKNIAQNYNKGFKSAFTKVEIKNIINIWSYISTLNLEIEVNKKISLLGDFFLQTQHYDDPGREGKGLVPKIGQYINQVEQMVHKYDPKLPKMMTRRNDHSKQSFSVIEFQKNQKDQVVVPSQPNQYEYNWFCVGDNNFMDKQSERGGSVHCFKNPTLCKFFSKKVYSYYYVDSNAEKQFYNGKIQESINEHMSKVLFKEFDYNLVSGRLTKMKQNTPGFDQLMSFPPPNIIDLYAQFDGGEMMDFKTFNRLLKVSENDQKKHLSDDPISFCWLSSYYYPNIFFCDDINCDNYKPVNLCTLPEIFSYIYYQKKDDQQTTVFKGMGINGFDILSIFDFEMDVSLKTLFGNIYNSKEKVYFYIKPLPWTMPIFKSPQDVTDFCQRKSIKNGKEITINYLYGEQFEYCVDVFKYCKTFSEGLLITNVDERNTNLGSSTDFNCNLFSTIEEDWNQQLEESNVIPSTNQLNDQINKFRINPIFDEDD